ncbi:hypothetical protein AC578_1041 [Pseudocercospora eumusae]|uniref:BTB domain-containing protein n=1 Tax=Pseudocercospora eumusae TaxID=321146 RepID=A0A139HTF2_9PEZI|nr:hypothetical protein AC578_1041 [Pseudocercospora eumusae]
MLFESQRSPTSVAVSPQPRPICIIVKEGDRTLGDFWTTSELLCSASPYFRVMLTGPFSEANNRHVTIDQHPVWIVEAFLNFLNFGRLASDEDHDHSDLLFDQLFQLYQFADFYQVRGLRNLIVMRVQKNLHYHISPHHRLSTLTQDDLPSVKEFKYLCKNMPESSPLRKVIADAVVNFNAQFSPVQVTARLTSGSARGRIVVPEIFKQDCDAARSRQVQVVMCSSCARELPCDVHKPLESHRYRFSSKALCLYHEHDTYQEQSDCQTRMASVIEGSWFGTLSIMSQDSNPTPAAPPLSEMARLNILDPAQPIDLEVDMNDGQVLRFSAMRSYLCAYSRYFRVLFEGHWADSGKHTIKIDDLEFVHPWVVPCVISWMYTQKLSLRGIPGSFLDCIADGVDLDDFTTWSYCMLWALYGFADRYEIQALRTIVIRQVQMKMFRGMSKKWSELPTLDDLRTLDEEIPNPESALRQAVSWMFRWLPPVDKDDNGAAALKHRESTRFWCSDISRTYAARRYPIDCKECTFATEWENYPLPENYKRSCAIHSEADFLRFNERSCPRAWCIGFHEHETELEALSCQKLMGTQTGVLPMPKMTDRAKSSYEYYSERPDLWANLKKRLEALKSKNTSNLEG